MARGGQGSLAATLKRPDSLRTLGLSAAVYCGACFVVSAAIYLAMGLSGSIPMTNPQTGETAVTFLAPKTWMILSVVLGIGATIVCLGGLIGLGLVVLSFEMGKARQALVAGLFAFAAVAVCAVPELVAPLGPDYMLLRCVGIAAVNLAMALAAILLGNKLR